ncbi:tRNA (cytosine(38)-C(5))-methyltransferase-like [Asterias amurensis]|uniref:tRNA (cytosine(38)-C(5))-methyltransferase-like n=1 Tax=Asterias amurensis TaxID=7602 RepID=UPI003AB4E87A
MGLFVLIVLIMIVKSVEGDGSSPTFSENNVCQDTREKVNELQVSVSGFQENVTSEVLGIRRQLEQLGVLVSALAEFLHDTSPMNQASTAVATERTATTETASHLEASVVTAVDINDLANKIYQHNFPDVNLMQRNIQSLTRAEFTALDADMFLMSPPCQPFTRVGLKGDSDDPRTQSFIQLLDLLPKLSKLPSYILVENVKGFETSNTRSRLIQTLRQCSYTYQEFLLSPYHFNISNQRLRYFMVAKHRPLVFESTNISDEEHRVLQQQRILEDPPCHEDKHVASENSFGSSDSVEKNVVVSSCSCCKDETNLGVASCSQRLRDVMISDQEDSSSCQTVNPSTNQQSTSHPTGANSKSDSSYSRNSSPLEVLDTFGREGADPRDPLDSQNPDDLHGHLVGDYLENLSAEQEERFLLQDKLLMRFARIIDVVTCQDCNTRCFTKAYGHYVEGTGSMLQVNSSLKVSFESSPFCSTNINNL